TDRFRLVPSNLRQLMLVRSQPGQVVIRQQDAFSALDKRRRLNCFLGSAERLKVLGKHDGRPGLELLNELDRFELGRLKRKQSGIKIRSQRKWQANYQQRNPHRRASQVAPACARRRTEVRQLVAASHAHWNYRQQSRQNDITGKQTEQESAAGDDAQLRGASEMCKHGYKKRACGAEAGRVDRQSDM